MPKLKEFDSIRQAVAHVCSGSVGPFSSGETLERTVLMHLSETTLNKIATQSTPIRTRLMQERNIWRKKNGVTGDCRTYDTQHRRDMKNDQKINASALRDMTALIESVGYKVLTRFLSKFHSIDQLRLAAKHTNELNEYIDLSTV